MTKKFFAILLACAMILSLAACGSSTAATTATAKESAKTTTSFKAMTWSAATSGADGSNFAVGLQKFAELMKEKTNGAVTVEIYTSDQLTNGNQADSLQGVMDGTIDMAFQDFGLWGNFDDTCNVLFLPFLFSSTDELDSKLINGEGGKYLRNLLESEYSIKTLGFGESGFRYITNNKHAVKTPEDLKGLKLRVAGSPMLTASYAAWGADYTVAPFSEVYTGLQTGLYDGQENPVAVTNASSIQEVTKYVTKWTAQYSGMLMFMNKDLYNSLSDELKAIVDECGKEACAYQVTYTRQQNDTLLQKWHDDYGIEVDEITPENMQKFKDLSKSIIEDYAAKHPEAYKLFS